MSLAASVPHDGLSAYIAGLCFVPPEYDLALIKTLDGAAPLAAVVGATLNFEVTVLNQGTVGSGAYTVTDTLPAGTSYVSDTSGSTANVSGDEVSWTFGNLASAASRSFVVTVRINDATLGTYRNDAEITADSGADIDSDPAGGATCLDGWDNHNDPSSDTDGPGGACDDHDAEVVTLAQTYSIGNRVWLDANNNGIQDSGETPLANIWMELFTDSNADGMPDDINADGVIADADAVATTGTNSEGLYLFDSLAAGKYIVGIPPMEWESGQPLVGMISSTIDSVSTDSNSDVDDDGRDGKDGYIMSTTIMLGDGEPTGETPDNDTLTPDVNENLTVDFGFWTPQFDLALRKQLQSGANTGVVAAGDPVTFTIRVLNQGNVAAADITVVDYIPVGLTLNDSDWTLEGSTASIALAGVTLAPGESTSVDITFTVSGTSNSMVNLAEISSARPVDAAGSTIMTKAGSALVDIDSTPDTNNSETPSDDVVDNTNGDEDDHDVASVTLAAQGPGGGQLPATGASTTGLWYPATIALLIGALLLVLERQRNRLV